MKGSTNIHVIYGPVANVEEGYKRLGKTLGRGDLRRIGRGAFEGEYAIFFRCSTNYIVKVRNGVFRFQWRGR